MLTRRADILVLFLIFKYDVSCRFCVVALYQVEDVPFCSSQWHLNIPKLNSPLLFALPSVKLKSLSCRHYSPVLGWIP